MPARPLLWSSRILLLALLLAAPLAADDFVGDGPWVVRAWFGDDAMVREVASWGEHFSDYHDSKGFLVLEADAETLGKLRTLGFFVEIDEERTAAIRRAEEAWRAGGESPDGIPGFPCYRTVEETFASAQALAAARPDLATVIDSGDSWEKTNLPPSSGYDMLVLKLTNGAIPGPKPVFFNTAAIHAREYTTAETAIRFAEWLVNGYGVDADATWLLDHNEYHLMLHANPDGRKKAETGLSWRKNTNQDYCGATSNSRGADLNRNFDFYWGAWGGSSSDPCSSTYRGAAPASEPETQAVQGYEAGVLIDQRPDDLTTPAPDDTTGVYVDLHSHQPAILTPFGLTSSSGDVCLGTNLAPNCEGMLRLGRKWGRLSAWDPRVGGLYPVDGSTKDYAYGRFGVPAYTWEMGTAFFEQCDDFEEAIAEPGREMLLYTLRVARAPYMLPKGPDSYRVVALPGAVEAGTPVALTAMAADGRVFDEETGQPEPANPIAEARGYVDTPPWDPGATPIALAAVDGTFDSPLEALEGTIPTTGRAQGVHVVSVHARD
ncbi:MAG TPA: M14 family zinc carboxypeptidase, partial [Thermoanaerobaculia bacterium]|nr:M14 family zinc carboxypeptidase [Thermoanaerobaculia bacterium]